jgi:hypothetical protein
LEKCIIVCRLKFKQDPNLDYETIKTICLGTFPDHESAGDFMTECAEDDRNLKECLNMLYQDEATSIDHWEVADYIDTEDIAKNWTNHATARRSTQERGFYNYS